MVLLQGSLWSLLFGSPNAARLKVNGVCQRDDGCMYLFAVAAAEKYLALSRQHLLPLMQPLDLKDRKRNNVQHHHLLRHNNSCLFPFNSPAPSSNSYPLPFPFLPFSCFLDPALLLSSCNPIAGPVSLGSPCLRTQRCWPLPNFPSTLFSSLDNPSVCVLSPRKALAVP